MSHEGGDLIRTPPIPDPPSSGWGVISQHAHPPLLASCLLPDYLSRACSMSRARARMSRTHSGYGPVHERLDDEVGRYPPIIRVHVGAVRVEDAGHFHAQLVLAVIVEEQRLAQRFPSS